MESDLETVKKFISQLISQAQPHTETPVKDHSSSTQIPVVSPALETVKPCPPVPPNLAIVPYRPLHLSKIA